MRDENFRLPKMAELLKVADKTVYTMGQKQKLPSFKVGGQWRFKRADIEAWIEQQKGGFLAQGKALKWPRPTTCLT